MAVKRAYSSLLVLFLFTSLYAQEDTVIRIDTVVQQEKYTTVQEFWSQMDDLFNDPNFSNANWGVVIQSLETGEFLYKRNENKFFMPASNLKLFTSAAALILLGGDYTFETNVYLNGKIDGSILMGDLIVEGKGDPTISGRFHNNDMLRVYKSWADSLIEQGIDEITGNIIGDDNHFDDIGLGDGWAWNYESYWYAAPSGAISFNDNCVDIYVTVDKESSIPRIDISPVTKYVIIINDVTAVPDDSLTSIDVYRERGTNVVNVLGTIRMSDSVKTFVTVNNPTQYAMVTVKDVLQSKGIAVDGYPIDIDDINTTLNYDSMKKLTTHYSQPLREILKVINKNSNNFYAEQLLKTLGLVEDNQGTSVNGIKALLSILSEMGINPENIMIKDGSGLSPQNYISPRQMVNLLTYMYKSKYFVDFFNSLPIAGIDGTLGKRMTSSLAKGKVRAKTGYLSTVRSLSGYAFTADDEPIAFSIIVNNFNVPVKLAENLQDLVCLRLASLKRK
ncbi:MAG: D-alanyl-D-alanine carboxypeptidase/D-alanyl-D-alanine-endopeptidase [Ignavibacteriales bacterium]|nr:MAG: D-alanyl-D-alanine carboxypeptidase/D-alanyl-D-alanine-endopeptidase [Ignavibacteriales bacterium]